MHEQIVSTVWCVVFTPEKTNLIPKHPMVLGNRVVNDYRRFYCTSPGVRSYEEFEVSAEGALIFNAGFHCIQDTKAHFEFKMRQETLNLLRCYLPQELLKFSKDDILSVAYHFHPDRYIWKATWSEEECFLVALSD